MNYTIVGVYLEDNEVLVEHVSAENVEAALVKFYNDPDSGEGRRDGCKIVSVFNDFIFDQIPDCPNINTDDLLTYDEHIKPLENK